MMIRTRIVQAVAAACAAAAATGCGATLALCDPCPDVQGKYTARLSALLVSKGCTGETDAIAGFAAEVFATPQDPPVVEARKTLSLAAGWITLKAPQNEGVVQIPIGKVDFPGSLYAASEGKSPFIAQATPYTVTLVGQPYTVSGQLTGSFAGSGVTAQYRGRLDKAGAELCTIDGEIVAAKNP